MRWLLNTDKIKYDRLVRPHSLHSSLPPPLPSRVPSLPLSPPLSPSLYLSLSLSPSLSLSLSVSLYLSISLPLSLSVSLSLYLSLPLSLSLLLSLSLSLSPLSLYIFHGECMPARNSIRLTWHEGRWHNRSRPTSTCVCVSQLAAPTLHVLHVSPSTIHRAIVLGQLPPVTYGQPYTTLTFIMIILHIIGVYRWILA